MTDIIGKIEQLTEGVPEDVFGNDKVLVKVKRIRNRMLTDSYVEVRRCSAWSPEGDRCTLAAGHSGSHEPWQGSGYAFGGTEYDCPPPNGGTEQEASHDQDQPHQGGRHIAHHIRWLALTLAVNIVLLKAEHTIYNATLGHLPFFGSIG